MAFSVSKRVSTRSIVENCPPKPIPAKLCFKKGLKPIFWRKFHRGVSFFAGFYRRVGFFFRNKVQPKLFFFEPVHKKRWLRTLKKIKYSFCFNGKIAINTLQTVAITLEQLLLNLSSNKGLFSSVCGGFFIHHVFFQKKTELRCSSKNRLL